MNNLLDDDGENRAVRWFLAYYEGHTSVTVEGMKQHLRMCGYPLWPEWCEDPGQANQHLTKAGAQLWIRHLCSLEAPAPIRQPEVGRVKINNEWYTRPVVSVAAVTVDGSTYIVPIDDLLATIGDGQEYTVQIRKMRVKEFERMEEFQGW